MGDRISIQFKNRDSKSIVLFSHWGGKEFLKIARRYTKELIAEVGEEESYPLDRLEPKTVIVDFIRYLLEQKEVYLSKGRIASGIYFGKDENDGDNSDNGHFVITLKKGAEK